MRKFILASALALAGASALAQVNVVPQVGTISAINRNPTYTASSVALVPAASATDIACLIGSSTKFVSLRRLVISGTAGTAITTPFLLYRRVSLNTGGTAATSLALPVAVPNLASDPAATATLNAWTANPTIVDSSPSLMAVLTPSLGVTTSANNPAEVSRVWGTGIDMFHRGMDITKSATTQLCVNLNAVSVSSGVVNITFDWQESN